MVVNVRSERVIYERSQRECNLEINGKHVSLLRWHKYDPILHEYDAGCEIFPEDKKALTKAELREVEEFISSGTIT